MSKILPGLLPILILGAFAANAQTVRPIPYPVIPNVKFDRAVENGTRTITGEPGPNYWTNTADYLIDASLDPATRIIRGSERIYYTNNSPDELDRLMVHLRQNLHQAGVVRNRAQKLTDGVRILSVASGGDLLHENAQLDTPGFRVAGTLMTVILPTPLAPGSSIDLTVDWEVEIP